MKLFYVSVKSTDCFMHREGSIMDLCIFLHLLKLSCWVSIHCQVTGGMTFICRLSVSHLWWGRWKLQSAPCPLLPRGLQTLGRVCFACSAAWKLFPPSGRWCSVCSPCRRLRKRAAIKSDPPQCLMVAEWCKHRPRKNTSQWLQQLETLLLKP